MEQTGSQYESEPSAFGWSGGKLPHNACVCASGRILIMKRRLWRILCQCDCIASGSCSSTATFGSVDSGLPIVQTQISADTGSGHQWSWFFLNSFFFKSPPTCSKYFSVCWPRIYPPPCRPQNVILPPQQSKIGIGIGQHWSINHTPARYFRIQLRFVESSTSLRGFDSTLIITDRLTDYASQRWRPVNIPAWKHKAIKNLEYIII